MIADHPQLTRLHRLLDEPDWEDEWTGDPGVRRALTSEWRLARHVAAGDEDNRSKYAQNLEDSAESEKRVRVDHAGRYPIELLQNAQDACADAGVRGKAWFRVTDNALLVGNQGVPFDAERIRSLVRLGGTTKQPGDPAHHTIGYKGIGFTSVLDVSERPQIISSGVAFTLDRRLANAELGRVLDMPVTRAPARYFPFPATPADWEDDATEVENLLSDGAVSVVRLPFRQGVEPGQVLDLVREILTPATLLLMPALDGLDAGNGWSWRRRRGRRIAGGQLHHIAGDGAEKHSWLVAERRVPVAPEVVEALEDEVWSNVRDLHVLVGIPWVDGRPAGEAEGVVPIHAYFPTDDHAGRGILIHGDFFLASNRRHILAKGPGGEVSATAAKGIVQAVGELAESYCLEHPDRGSELLRCLAPRREPQGYGAYLSGLLDEDLAGRGVVQTIQGRLIAPADAKIVGVDMPIREHRDFADMLLSVEGLATPAYERAASSWLRNLGSQALPVPDVVANIEPSVAPSYSRVLLAVKAWWQGEARWAHRLALRSMRILKSTAGPWHSAHELCEPVSGVPPLPPGLEKEEYQAPRNPAAAEFVADELEVEPLDLDRSLDLVLQAVTNGTYGRAAGEHQAVHDFAWAIFRTDRSILESHRLRGNVPVPVRSWRRGPAREWRAGEDVYFSRDWTGTPDLEWLYRRFGEREFLAEEPPKGRRRAAEARAFYRAVRVADEPRRDEHNGKMWEAPAGWVARDDVVAAQRCPDEHPYTARQFQYEILDRLPQVLDGLDTTEARALTNLLARQRNPYGPEARVWCLHSAHRNRVTRRAIGFQHWLLLTRPWIPVRGNTAGQNLVRPDEAWVDVNGRALKACLAQADVPKTTAEKLRLPSAANPTSDAVAKALVKLQESYPELEEAPPDVRSGSVLLLQSLEGALKREGTRQEELPRLFLPCTRENAMKWSERPAVPDIYVPSDLPIDVLPAGSWTALPRTFDLPRASEVMTITTEAVGEWELELPGLGVRAKVELTALLRSKGADLKVVARRLGKLRVRGCQQLRTTYRVGNSSVTYTPHLRLDADGDESATLYIADSFAEGDRAELANVIADHVGAPESRDAVLLSLAQVPQLLHAFGISEAGLDEAREALRRYVQDEELVEAPRDRGGDVPESKGNSGAGGNSEESPAGKKSPTGETTGGSGTGAPDPYAAEGGEGTQRGERQGEPSAADTIGHTEGRIGFSPQSTETAAPAPSGAGVSGARGGTGRSGQPSVSSERRRAAELGAIQVATQYAREELGCVDVRDVQEDNKGWDLEFLFESNEWWPVEVKGFSATASAFILTRNEVAAAREHREYRVLLVTGIDKGTGELVVLEDPGSWLHEDDLEAMAWAIRDWREHTGVRLAWAADQGSRPPSHSD